MPVPLITIVTITKDDPIGLARTLTSGEVWRALSWVEQVLVFTGDNAPITADKSVRMLRQQSQGIVGAFNEGLAIAQGDWIWFLNGGDAIHESLKPEWLFELLRNTGAGVVTGALHYDGDDLPHAAPPLRMQWPLLTSWFPHPSTLVRRSALNQIGGFDPRWKVCMDFDLWYRLLSRSTMVDVLAVPFARFDVTGISNRPESGPLLFSENIAVLWKHKAIILSTCWEKGWNLVLVFLRAAKNRWF